MGVVLSAVVVLTACDMGGRWCKAENKGTLFTQGKRTLSWRGSVWWSWQCYLTPSQGAFSCDHGGTVSPGELLTYVCAFPEMSACAALHCHLRCVLGEECYAA